MATTPVTLDFSKSQPISGDPPAQNQAPAVALDFTRAQTLDDSSAPTPSSAPNTPPSNGDGWMRSDGSTWNPNTDPGYSDPISHDAQLLAPPSRDTVAARIKNWSQNVANDLKYGSDTTGIGKVMKSLGAHGVYMGNSQAVGDFMASLPLGLLKATQGGAEVTQPGSRWQGTKDIAGGLLDASTIPGGFMAPETGESAASIVDSAASSSARAVKNTAKSLLRYTDPTAVQPALQRDVRNILADVAKEAGVDVPNTDSIRDVARATADAVLAKSKSLYATLDEATGGQFQRFDNALRNVNRRLREVSGLDDESESALQAKKAELETAQQDTFEKAKQAGVDPQLVDKASASWKHGQALMDLDNQLKRASSGMRPDLAPSEGAYSPEILDPKKIFTRLNNLYDSGRLQQALGPEKAGQMLQTADQAFLHAQKIANRAQILKTVAKGAKIGGAATAIGVGAKTAKDLFLGNN